MQPIEEDIVQDIHERFAALAVRLEGAFRDDFNARVDDARGKLVRAIVRREARRIGSLLFPPTELPESVVDVLAMGLEFLGPMALALYPDKVDLFSGFDLAVSDLDEADAPQ